MNHKQKKKELIDSVKDILNQLEAEAPYINRESLTNLLEDIENSIYTVVFSGEFKRGKSTFINAILGQAVMPADVTPTTACIHTVTYGEESATIYYNDDSIRSFSLDEDQLLDYSAEGTQSISDIKYINIELPIPLLQERVALVDTPGLDDINEQRSNITYQYIPRADVVFFLLDITSPLKQSESNFLQNTLLNQGKENLIFIANFIDRVEEEDIEEILDDLRKRLKRSGIPSPYVIPLSASWALEGSLKEDQKLTDISGIHEARRALEENINHGTASSETLFRYEKRFYHLMENLDAAVSFQLNNELEETEVRQERLLAIREAREEIDQIKEDMEGYIVDRKREILQIVKKSLDYLENNLNEDVQAMISRYDGMNFERLLDEDVPNVIKKRLKTWSEQYISQIHYLFNSLEQNVAIGLAKQFNAKVEKIYTERKALIASGETSLSGIHAEDLSNTPVKAGMIAGGAGTIAMLIGGPILLPIIGLAGMPILQKYMSEKKTDKIKGEVLPSVLEKLHQTTNHFQSEVLNYVDQGVDAIFEAGVQRMNETVEDRISQLKQTMEDETRGQLDSEKRIEALKRLKLNVNNYIECYGHVERKLVERKYSDVQPNAKK
ncbi:dynamin family protein [Alkalicoccus chagannorensis]|uniref:dynamin family protein n=1 Tax=Alkalicoccus chagannorensis TaxID=427072 RepID=UPI000402BFFE|nr:dynamin family protein [Alkalicoccus chagannorensis]